MSENVRERILSEVVWAYARGYGDGRDGHLDRHGDHNGATDRIIALVTEALLSDAAVEAAARAIHRTEHLLTGAWSAADLHESQLVNGPRTLDEEEREGYRYTARLSAKALIAAASWPNAGEKEPPKPLDIDKHVWTEITDWNKLP